MNYYKRHIGDYARKTRHLSLLEHGVYTVLLDTYYDRERPLSENEAIRFTNARTDEELRAVKTVLSEFFHEENGLFSQSHADEELQSFHKRQKINRKLGAIGGKRNAKRIESESLSELEANEKPPISHKPLANIDQKQDQKSLRTSCASASELLADVSAEVARDFTELRKKKRAPLTATAVKGIRREAAKAGLTLEAALVICCERGWTGFRADWDWRASIRAGPQSGATSKAGQAIEILEGMKRGHQNLDSGTDAAVLMPRIGSTASG